MTQSGNARREIEALRERFSTLSAAILRISATLDLDTVLAEVVESARTLTGARYGVLATVVETGAPTRESVFSGFTPEERRELAAWPDSGRLFEHLRHLPGPLRLADLGPQRVGDRASHSRAAGVAQGAFFPRGKAHCAPRRARGASPRHRDQHHRRPVVPARPAQLTTRPPRIEPDRDATCRVRYGESSC